MEVDPPVSSHNITSDNLQTWNLRVYIHCEGCKRKVFKLLQSIDGVYKTVIDSKQHKATVTGSVNGDTLVHKLLKSGKHAHILTSANASANPNNNTQNDAISTGDDEKEESRNATPTEGLNEEQAPYQNYYPTLACSCVESLCYSSSVYGYAQCLNPSVYYWPPPPPTYYSRSAFDDHDDEAGDGIRRCTFM